MNSRPAISTLVLSLVAAACATTSTFSAEPRDLRPARDTPITFVTVDGVSGVPDWCANPLIDPRDQTRLRLVRSGAVGSVQQGDYAVEGGQYGVGPGELLRIECSTGQTIGIVPG